MNERIRRFREDLIEGLIHRDHQMMYPIMSADYFEQAQIRYQSEPIFAARIQALEAGIFDLLEKHGFIKAVEREDGER